MNDLELELMRISTGENDTLGILFATERFSTPTGEEEIDREALCFTLEDEHREIKVPGETRIPAGTYKIGLRTVGGHHARYSKKYPEHIGMLHLLDVPNFKYVLIHVGNTEDDTAGCILVGEQADLIGERRKILRSVAAYRSIYPRLAKVAKSGSLSITIKDFA